MHSHSPVVYSSYPGFGTWSEANTHYSQVARVGDVLHVSGQGGWDQYWTPDSGTRGFPTDVAEELAQAFVMVDVALRDAGVERSWEAVYKTRIFSTLPVDDPAVLAAFVEQVRKWCPEHLPTATVVSVSKLALEGMRFEVEAEAYDPKEKA